MYIHTEAGEWLPEAGGGILVPYQMVEDRGKRGGGRVCPAGQRGSARLRVCGLYNGELTMPSQFSYARLDQSDYVGAGVNTPDGLPETPGPTARCL